MEEEAGEAMRSVNGEGWNMYACNLFSSIESKDWKIKALELNRTSVHAKQNLAICNRLAFVLLSTYTSRSSPHSNLNLALLVANLGLRPK